MSDTRERCVHGWVDPLEWCTSCMAARIAELEAQVKVAFQAGAVLGSAWTLGNTGASDATPMPEVRAKALEAADYALTKFDEWAAGALAHPLIGGAK